MHYEDDFFLFIREKTMSSLDLDDVSVTCIEQEWHENNVIDFETSIRYLDILQWL